MVSSGGKTIYSTLFNKLMFDLKKVAYPGEC